MTTQQLNSLNSSRNPLLDTVRC